MIQFILVAVIMGLLLIIARAYFWACVVFLIIGAFLYHRGEPKVETTGD